ncbi:uncharacterized protein LOC133176278 [Saccostrea echinata]|uniref:uncharacterized protein LOC133176278 n=1 Tax=Saccostrea echinata TaxID=191078 RepID=UPI002A80CFAD|nr:uncharacterized protein LOC133176278 [Saccostrea echinata]
MYHCTVNEWKNATLEVCAPMRIVFGHCVEFNVRAARIQHNRQSCRRFTNPCPVHYDSTDVYKYSKCFRIQQTSELNPEIISFDDESNNSAISARKDEIFANEHLEENTEKGHGNGAEKLMKMNQMLSIMLFEFAYVLYITTGVFNFNEPFFFLFNIFSNLY